MNFRSLIIVLTVFCPYLVKATPRSWPMESTADEAQMVRGKATVVAGVQGRALALDGESLIEIEDSAKLTHDQAGFAFTVWVNPFEPGGEQQMIVGKNRYSSDEREWSLMIEKDARFRLYVRQDGWRTVSSPEPAKAGHWYHVGVVLRPQRAELWVNGREMGNIELKQPLPRTEAPITLGGLSDRGSLVQLFFGALDEARYDDKPLPGSEMAELYRPIPATLPIPERPKPPLVESDSKWDQQEAADAQQDRSSIVFNGRSPNRLACDTTLREMPDGSWVMVMLGGGDREPDPMNQVFLCRSHDEGNTWSELRPLDFGFPRAGNTTAMVPSELMIYQGTCTLFFATHNGKFDGWKEWMVNSADSCRTWQKPVPVPGRLHDRTFIRNHIVTRDGRIMLPFQHYLGAPGPLDPRNGVLISQDQGKTWTEHGDIRLSTDNGYRGWAENNIVELQDGHVGMIIRADRLGGVLYYAESADGGVTWPGMASKGNIPNPGSKATLYGLGNNMVALLHNPHQKTRRPLALWVSFDGMKSWPYQRVLRGDLEGVFNYPDGFVSADKKWLHFAFDHNRNRAIHVSARLPELPAR